MIPPELLATLAVWERDEITGSITINFAEGVITSYEVRQHQRILRSRLTQPHTAPAMSSQKGAAMR